MVKYTCKQNCICRFCDWKEKLESRPNELFEGLEVRRQWEINLMSALLFQGGLIKLFGFYFVEDLIF